MAEQQQTKLKAGSQIDAIALSTRRQQVNNMRDLHTPLRTQKVYKKLDIDPQKTLRNDAIQQMWGVTLRRALNTCDALDACKAVSHKKNDWSFL